MTNTSFQAAYSMVGYRFTEFLLDPTLERRKLLDSATGIFLEVFTIDREGASLRHGCTCPACINQEGVKR